MILKMCVAGTNPDGKSDFFFCKVECTPQQYEYGQHYEQAEGAAYEAKFQEPFVVFDENDKHAAALMANFDWDTARTFKVAWFSWLTSTKDIINRKKSGLDADEYESDLIKTYFRTSVNSPQESNSELLAESQKLFPLEWDEVCGENKRSRSNEYGESK